MSQKTLLGFIAAAAATLAIFIALCILGVSEWAPRVLNLLAFLLSGLASLIRLVCLLDDKGVVAIEFVRGNNKKLITLTTIGVGGVCCLFTFLAAIIAAATFSGHDLGIVSGPFWFSVVCIFLGCFASAANVVLAFLEMRESQDPPPPAS